MLLQMFGLQLAFLCVDIYQQNIYTNRTSIPNHEVENAIPIA